MDGGAQGKSEMLLLPLLLLLLLLPSLSGEQQQLASNRRTKVATSWCEVVVLEAACCEGLRRSNSTVHDRPGWV